MGGRDRGCGRERRRGGEGIEVGRGRGVERGDRWGLEQGEGGNSEEATCVHCRTAQPSDCK